MEVGSRDMVCMVACLWYAINRAEVYAFPMALQSTSGVSSIHSDNSGLVQAMQNGEENFDWALPRVLIYGHRFWNPSICCM